MTPTAMAPLGLSFTASGTAHIIFFFIIGFYLIFTAILYYHWQTYSTDVRMNFVTTVLYFGITIPIIITLTAAAALL